MEEDKTTKKKLKSLQNKWITSVKEDEKDDDTALMMDFSELDASGKKEGKKKKKEKKKKEVLLPDELDAAAPHRAPAEGTVAVDYDLINEMVQRAVNMEVERAIRELKSEIRDSSETSKKELFDQLKLELDTLRQEIEFSGRTKRQKGLFDRF